MTLDPHTAERLICIGCHDAMSRKHALRLHLHPADRAIWIDQTARFLADTIKYDSTSCAVFVDPQFSEWPEAQGVVTITREHYKQARINQNTVETIGDAQGRNFIRNLRRIVHGGDVIRPIALGLPSMKGYTAIVCGAGPSFHLTADAVAKHDGPIIAVNTSAGACMQRGITPHVVVCTESKMVREGIERMDPAVSLLAMDLIGHVANWFGGDSSTAREQLCFMGTEPNLASYARALDMMPLAYGSSCTTAAVSLAFACGADKVVLVGQDCGFMLEPDADQVYEGEGLLEARMYAAGTPYEETTVTIDVPHLRAVIDKPTVGKFETDVLLADSVADGDTWTTHSMLSFAHWFMDQPPDVCSRIVNCSAAGVYIEGIEHGPIEDHIQRVAMSYGTFRNFDPHKRQTDAFGVCVRRLFDDLMDMAGTGVTMRDDVKALQWARHHPILNMWVSPEWLRMRRQPELSSAARGHRTAAVIRHACQEILECGSGLR